MLSNQPNKLNINCNQKRSSLNVFSANQVMKSVDFEFIIDALDVLFLEMYDRPLSTVEELLLKGVWQNKTYSEIAQENHYSSDYFSNVAAPKLLKQLSQLFRYRITKKNCRSMIIKYFS